MFFQVTRRQVFIHSFIPYGLLGMHRPQPDEKFSGDGGSSLFRTGSSADSVVDISDIRVSSDSAPGSLLEYPAQIRGTSLGDMTVADRVGGLKSSGSNSGVTGQLFWMRKPGEAAGFHQDSSRGQISDTRSGSKSGGILIKRRDTLNSEEEVAFCLSQLSFQQEELVGEIKPALCIHGVETIPIGVKVSNGSGAGESLRARQVSTEGNAPHTGFGAGSPAGQVVAMTELLSNRIEGFAKDKACGDFSTPQDFTDETSILKVSFDIPISHGMKPGSISQDEEIGVGFQQEPEPTVETHGFKSHTYRPFPLLNETDNSFPTLGRNFPDANFLTTTVPGTPGKRIFMQVNADKSFHVLHRFSSQGKSACLSRASRLLKRKQASDFTCFHSVRSFVFFSGKPVGLSAEDLAQADLFLFFSLLRDLFLEVSYV
jgi:hypothetical protein